MVYVNCTFDNDPLDLNTTNKLTIARGWTAVGTALISLLLFVFASCNMGRKYWRYDKECECFCRFFITLFTSPFFLLAFITLLPVWVYWIILIRFPIYHSYTSAQFENVTHLYPKFCKWPGYTLVWFESAETMALAVFSLYILFYYIPFHSKENSMLVHREYVAFQRRRRNRRVNEAEYVTEYTAKVPKGTWQSHCHSILSVIVSLAIVIVCGVYTYPYFVEQAGPNSNNSISFGYGDVGPWCWIKPEEAQKDFWFYEEWTYMLISFVALLAGFIFLCCVVRNPMGNYRPFPSIWWDKTVLVPFSIFLVYFILQSGLLIIEILVRLCKNSDQALWYTYAIGKPLSKILLIIASLQLMSTSYRMGKKGRSLLGSTNSASL